MSQQFARKYLLEIGLVRDKKLASFAALIDRQGTTAMRSIASDATWPTALGCTADLLTQGQYPA